MDQIQIYFEDWYNNNNRASLEKAQEELIPIIEKKVRRFFRYLHLKRIVDVDDLFQRVLLNKLLTLKQRKTGGFSRSVPDLMAPIGHLVPERFRSKVLSNYFCDLFEEMQTHKHHRKAIEYGITVKNKKNTAYKQLCVEMKSKEAKIMDRDEVHRESVRNEACTEATQEEDVDLILKRELIEDRLDRLTIRNRVILSLELGLDPARYATALARELNEASIDVSNRIKRAVSTQKEHHRVAVLYQFVSSKNKEAYRKAKERVREKMKAYLMQLTM